MDRKLVSAEDHEIEYLARKHGTTKAKVVEIAKATGSRSRDEIKPPSTSGSNTSSGNLRSGGRRKMVRNSQSPYPLP